MPGRCKRSNTQPTETPSKRGRNTQRTGRVATEVSAPPQDTRELLRNLLTRDDIPMIVKVVMDSLLSQATSTTTTRTNSTGLGTETPAERARSSESTMENRLQHHDLGKLCIYPGMFVHIMYIIEELPSCSCKSCYQAGCAPSRDSG